jgi:hypothetical protein
VNEAAHLDAEHRNETREAPAADALGDDVEDSRARDDKEDERSDDEDRQRPESGSISRTRA